MPHEPVQPPKPTPEPATDGTSALVDQSRKQTDVSLDTERTKADEKLKAEHDARDDAQKDFRVEADKVIANARATNVPGAARQQSPEEQTVSLARERRAEDVVRDAERTFEDEEHKHELQVRTDEDVATARQRRATDQNLTSERVTEDRILALSEEPFRLLVTQVKDYAVFLLDPDGNIASWNEGAQRLKGYTAADVVGRHFSVFYPQADIDAGVPAEELRLALPLAVLKPKVGACAKTARASWRTSSSPRSTGPTVSTAASEKSPET